MRRPRFHRTVDQGCSQDEDLVAAGGAVEAYAFPDRDFRVWDRQVSHDRMVIRSPGPDWDGPHIDLEFWGVDYVRAPTHFDGLSIVSPNEAEIAEAAALGLPRFDPSTVRVLESGGRRYVVVAAGFSVAETNHPMMVTALFHPCPEHLKRPTDD